MTSTYGPTCSFARLRISGDYSDNPPCRRYGVDAAGKTCVRTGREKEGEVESAKKSARTVSLILRPGTTINRSRGAPALSGRSGPTVLMIFQINDDHRSGASTSEVTLYLLEVLRKS